MPTSFFTRRSFLNSSAAVAGLTACAAARGELFWTPELQAQMPMPAAHGALDLKLDAFVGAYMPAMNAPGMAFGLTDAEKTLRAAGYGYADIERREAVTVDHLFQIGSITKSFVALVILQLREQGKLDLQAAVLDYLPDLPIVTEFGTVTVHHLLTHTSGLPDNLGVFSADPAARLVQGFKPGEHFHYCNAGFDILGMLAAKLDGRPWRVLVEERIFKPLGMSGTKGVIVTADRRRAAVGYEPFRDDLVYPRHGELAPAPSLVLDDTAGCIQSTPGDMARYLRMLLNRGTGPEGRIVSEESFALMGTPYIKAEDFSPTASYGYGIAVDTLDGHKVLRHTGGMVAFASSILVDLDGGVAAFASINAMQGYRPTAVTEYAVRLVRAQQEGKALPDAPAIADPMQVDNAAEYAGTFRAPGGQSLEFKANGERLSLVVGDVTLPLQHAGGDMFVSTLLDRMAAYPITFGRGGSGEEKNPGPVVEVFYGPEWFAGERYAGPRSFHVPEEFGVYAGHYRSDSPWGGDARVYVLKDRLVVEGTPLAPLGQALFRAGEVWSPITAQFLIPFQGRTQLLRLGGMDYWRMEID